jgi:hypothetical protein
MRLSPPTIGHVKHVIVTLALMSLSAGATAYAFMARYAEASRKRAQECADETTKSAQECLHAARAVRDKDQQRCNRAVQTHDPSLCDWQAAQAVEPWPTTTGAASTAR